jgi:MFS family permease
MPSDFFKLICARFFFVLAMQMQAVLLGWQMYVLTENAFFLGLIGLAEAIPALGFALYAGYYVDHHKPLPVYYKLLLLGAISISLVFFCQADDNSLSLNFKISTLFLTSFLTGTVRAFAHPTIYTLIPGIVPRSLLSKAAAISASTLHVARIAGPAIGGLLFGFIGVSKTAAIICGLFLLAFCLATRISHSPEAPKKIESSESLAEKLLVGAKYVWRHPILFPAMTLDMVSVFLGGVTALLPIYVSEILHADSQELGFLRAAPAIGAALMGAVLIRIPLKQYAGKTMFAAVIGFGISICVFSVSENILLSLCSLIASGACDSISAVIRTSAIQLCSPDAIRGRISSVNSIFVSSSNELGEFESGTLAGFFGAVPTALFGGLACIATALVMMYRFPSLQKLDLHTLSATQRDPTVES